MPFLLWSIGGILFW